MPPFYVGIHGDPDRAAGLLAKVGIQTVGSHAYWVGPGSAEDAPIKGATARVDAEDGKSAVERVRHALHGEPFTVEDEARRNAANPARRRRIHPDLYPRRIGVAQ